MIEILIAILVGAIVLAIATGVGVMALIALLRTRRVSDLARRVELLEARLKAQQTGPAPMAAAASEQAVADVTVAPLGRPEAGPAASPTASARHRRPIQWELLIGQKAFGWVAVALAVFGTGYFLKYAYENRWVGPIGRVGFGVVGGVTLTIAGLWYYRRGGRILAQMLTACGIVVLYLATYSAFGFYDLLPSFHAGGFLTAVVLLSAIMAVCYDSPSIAMVAVLGGLVCPLLMRPEQDTYVALFCYLVSINLGVAVIALVRSWPFVSSVALYGTQGLFWSWYWGNYHPEKLGWSLAFQGLIFGLYVGQDLAVQLLRGTGARRETAFRILVNAACGFGAYYVLMRYDHRPWMGVSAVVMAAFYALLARGTLVIRRECTMELVTTISVAAGFLTLAIPLEADAHWLAVAWAATAVTIGWFSLRVELPALRLVAALIAALAVGRVAFVDLWSYPDDTWWLFFNSVAIPSAGVAAAMIAGVLISRRYWTRLGALQRVFASAAGLSGIVLLWLVLTVDIYSYFDRLAMLDVSDDSSRLLWLGGLCVSILWTLYASMLLAIGFRYGQRLLRWVAIGFFMLTVGKVFLVDTSELSELYRIVAFFILAFFLATAAVVYQRVRPGRHAGELEDSNGHAAC